MALYSASLFGNRHAGEHTLPANQHVAKERLNCERVATIRAIIAKRSKRS